ncbi:hypothetical protein BO82DRAFT_356566 [Aspergillus uvarum CBS 121591]|uniref:Uncharacterized protein n=1 Tax=Aspergillus uvarum CBS 121591 TaxID=1448315 RepID=A0A319CUA6_9EURO|nr:hypothetical protein BO82DRAFT_356566 [Aspergillus uvarum CBS 121591]PYH79188.1 hypothetical protein BO82DRAFT_356566 [Aspergillus uvarum CBS 121591]
MPDICPHCEPWKLPDLNPKPRSLFEQALVSAIQFIRQLVDPTTPKTPYDCKLIVILAIDPL